VSKTILSQAVSANLFKYVNFQRLLEAEVGFTKNEPVQLALKESIEKAVESLIIEGIEDNLWKPQLSEQETKALVEAYKEEQEEANSTELYDRYLTERRGTVAVTGALGMSLIDGDLPNPQPEFNSRVGLKYFLTPALNANFTYYKYNLENKELLNEGFMSFDFNLEYNILPYDEFTPFIYAGGGVNATNYFTSVDPKVQAGLGLEYLVSDNLGIQLFVDYNYVFSDELDLVIAGQRDDTFYRVGIGINYYFAKRKNKKKLDEGKLKELEAKRELKALKKKNRANRKKRNLSN
jgi:curli production assembly/transport component CsgG